MKKCVNVDKELHNALQSALIKSATKIVRPIKWLIEDTELPENDQDMCVVWYQDDYQFAWWFSGCNSWDLPDYGWVAKDDISKWVILPL